jgi:Uma2 family endonuclease
MATITETTRPQKSEQAPVGDQCVVMHEVGWRGYSALLRLRGERPRPKMVYLDGDLYLMSPAFAHEFLKKRLGNFVMVVVEELDIPCIPAGETTLRRKKKRGGAEGDETFYLANLEPIRKKQGKENINLRRDPPPDLVVEAVNTHDADATVEVWRRLGVPEVWVCDAESLQILALQADGSHARTPNSVAFPYLTAGEIFGWVTRPAEGSETAWIKELRRWVAGALPERCRKAEQAPEQERERP